MRFLRTLIFAKNRVIIASCRNLQLTFRSWTAICVRACVCLERGGGRICQIDCQESLQQFGDDPFMTGRYRKEGRGDRKQSLPCQWPINPRPGDAPSQLRPGGGDQNGHTFQLNSKS